MTVHENRQKTMDSLVLPTHALWPVTVRRLVRFNFHKV